MTARSASAGSAGSVPAAERAALPPGALAELGRRFGVRAVGPVRSPWVGATSSVVRLGDDLLVKVPHRDDAAVDACLTHARVCPVLRRKGVLVPEILAVLTAGDLAPVPLVVSRFVPGSALTPSDVRPGIWADVGQQVALVHRTAPGEVPPGLRSFTQHPEVDPAVVAERLADEGIVRPQTATTVRGVRDRLVPAVLPDDSPVLCHGDLHAGNVIAQDGGLTGLIDLAGAGWLDAAWDFAAIPAPAVRPALAGYAASGGRAGHLLERVAWCRFQLAVHRLATSRRPDDAASRAVGEVERLLGTPG
ncbi:aminoglycoside phosphotransferase family protein [Georgenia wangjunii]|uniref:aminoglycoside phosphotransferase family protein n=1 Tax=Georgenia wangjunii TaxID=3117730 RepID=UPI002F26DD53